MCTEHPENFTQSWLLVALFLCLRPRCEIYYRTVFMTTLLPPAELSSGNRRTVCGIAVHIWLPQCCVKQVREWHNFSEAQWQTPAGRWRVHALPKSSASLAALKHSTGGAIL